jgi:hypothetical protein
MNKKKKYGYWSYKLKKNALSVVVAIDFNGFIVWHSQSHPAAMNDISI